MANSREAEHQKELGNEAYKKRVFNVALEHYTKASELEPTNMVYLNNMAAVYLEQGEFQKCIDTCMKGVEIGRENRADFSNIAKALARAGTAALKLEKYSEALALFHKSVAEHRDPAVVKKASEVEKKIKELERLAYIDPEKALEEKNKGNKFFQDGKFPDAVRCYTEAIRRSPNDAKLYSNRAACYTKLLEFPLALKDAEECIRLEPTFVKGHLRKAQCHVAMKDLGRAASAYQKALELDPKCQEAIDGYRQCMMDEDPEAVRKRAMQDPEVREILQDPAMQLILQQMQRDPKALGEHLKNPQIAAKIEKLLESGLIAIR